MTQLETIIFSAVAGFVYAICRWFFPAVFSGKLYILFIVVIGVCLANLLIELFWLNNITKIYDPDEKIKALEKYMKRYIGKVKFTRERVLESNLLLLVGLTYSEKGEYEAALTFFIKARGFIPFSGNFQGKANTETRIYAALAEGLINLKRFDEAEQILMGLVAPLTNPMLYCMLQLISVEVDIHRGNTERARFVIADITPKMRELSERFKNPNLMGDVLMTEGNIAKAERNYAEAKAKYQEVLSFSSLYGHQRLARKELAEIAELERVEVEQAESKQIYDTTIV